MNRNKFWKWLVGSIIGLGAAYLGYDTYDGGLNDSKPTVDTVVTAPLNVSATTINALGFNDNIIGVGGFATYGYNQQRISKDFSNPRIGKYSLLFQSYNGDGAGGDRTGEKGADKTEVIGLLDANGSLITEDINSGVVVYGVSIKVPVNYSSQKRCIFVQFHKMDSDKEGGTGTAFSLSMDGRFYVASRHSGDIDKQTDEVHQYISDSLVRRGIWTDFVFEIKYSRNTDGYITVWRHDAGASYKRVLDVRNVSTCFYSSLQPSLIVKLIPHFGIYRHDEHPEVPDTSRYNIGSVIRSKNSKEVKTILK